MQMICVPKGKTAASYIAETRDQDTRNTMDTTGTGSMRYFSLDGALPTGQVLVLNAELGTLSLLSRDDERPCLAAQQQFTASELSLILPLLELYPHYAPYEVIFASFYNGAITDATVERCRRQLQEALEHGVWDQQLRPVRNTLSRIRFKMRNFGIDIISILETGYVLVVKSPEKSALRA